MYAFASERSSADGTRTRNVSCLKGRRLSLFVHRARQVLDVIGPLDPVSVHLVDL
jgi:hypothetical protein